MSYAVVFHDTGARIYHCIEPKDFYNVSNALVDPVCPQGTPPHYWKKVGKEIQVMTDLEKKKMDLRLEIMPVDRQESVLKYPELVIAAKLSASKISIEIGLIFMALNILFTTGACLLILRHLK